MKRKKAWSALPGTAPAEKLQVLGVEPHAMVDIRRLDEISRRYGVTVYLFFEEDLARNRSLESVIGEYGSVPIFERPYISVPDFLRFTRENDPSFEQTLQDFPLMVEIVSSGITLSGPDGDDMPVVTGLMPFLDELDVDAPPPEPGAFLP
ncbi:MULTISPECIES: hypothetical protein [unclassified Methanoregula]|uniref:hypothetical protein n=1 Tax=unclassified Methanoregula TaxID=2649730 RepID=UPI0009D3522F|nr:MULTISPECIES: hypothetical protein [unclassified Methanoregula]OPX62277.1 MAG: hypothetical protein A4E33_02346 [Methanoregula sp. PtaB.Bin085]OPY32704.1 MAG: hypothetical protein A4E34_02080 [Methanoregula sp. PtaU1.Bin006]